VDPGHDPTEITAVFLLDIAVIVVAARLGAAAFRRLGQPGVIGEIVVGILLGPSLLGALPGDPSTDLFPLDTRSSLKALGDVGLIIFIFMVGLQLDLGLARRLERAAGISASSVALPFALGVLLAAAFYPSHDTVNGSEVDFVPFALFIGVAMSVTAFPVLARILAERGIHGTQIGALVLACAAVDDVLGWSILAVALAALAGGGGTSDVLLTLLETAAFAVGMVVIIRPSLDYLFDRSQERGRGLTGGLLAVILAAIAASAWITDEIGVNFVFGAFVFGVAFPRRHAATLLAELKRQVEPLVLVLLLPIFFVLPGLSVNIRGLGLDDLGEFALIMLVACGGKLIGGGGMAKLLGSDWREAAAVGTLLNTRGVMELVVANVGLAAGVIDLDLYTILVLMAVVTTLMTTPLLKRIYSRELVEDRPGGGPAAPDSLPEVSPTV
jgi:Kef-type K+ transport system membrane component KefB